MKKRLNSNVIRHWSLPQKAGMQTLVWEINYGTRNRERALLSYCHAIRIKQIRCVVRNQILIISALCWHFLLVSDLRYSRSILRTVLPQRRSQRTNQRVNIRQHCHEFWPCWDSRGKFTQRTIKNKIPNTMTERCVYYILCRKLPQFSSATAVENMKISDQKETHLF